MKPKITLFKSEGNYFEQIRINPGSTFLNCEIKDNIPQKKGDTLLIHFYMSDEESTEEIIEEIPIGSFPLEVDQWNLKIKYFINGVEAEGIGDTELEQGEGDAEPKPVSEWID